MDGGPVEPGLKEFQPLRVIRIIFAIVTAWILACGFGCARLELALELLVWTVDLV